METMLTDIGTVVTQSLSWVGTVATTIAAQPILLIPVALSIGLVCVGLFKSLFHV